MRQGVKAKPELIKPNLDELQELLGRKLETVEEVAEAADELRAQGIPMVCVSMGSRGALLSVRAGLLVCQKRNRTDPRPAGCRRCHGSGYGYADFAGCYSRIRITNGNGCG